MDAERRMLELARAAGCPADQMLNFRLGGYVPQSKQILFHAACRAADASDGPTQIGYGGARGPGKSHAMFAQLALDDCQRYDGLKILMLRKVGKALKESAADLRRKLLKHIPNKYNKTTGTTEFKNGSRIVLGHFRTEADIDAYTGLEYDVVAIEEATTLSGQRYKMIRTCCRTSKADWRPRVYSNANPGGIGHAYYHELFIKGTSPDVRFVPATYKDNAFLDKQYVKTLESLTGWLRRAWLHGDWNIHAGMYFTNFDKSIHVVNALRMTDSGWIFYLVLDYGFQHPTAALLLAERGENVYVVDEYRESKTLTPQHSKALDGMLARWGLNRGHVNTFVVGQDAWRRDKGGTSVADEYEDEGWAPESAIMARVQGAQEVLRKLGDVEAKIPPTLWIFKNCEGLIGQLPQMQHDPRRPEDVLKVDADDEGIGGDDLYDALRYGLQAVRAQTGSVSAGSLSFRR